MCGRVGPSRTSVREGKGYYVRGGGGEEMKCAKERASGVRLHYNKHTKIDPEGCSFGRC